MSDGQRASLFELAVVSWRSASGNRGILHAFREAAILLFSPSLCSALATAHVDNNTNEGFASTAFSFQLSKTRSSRLFWMTLKSAKRVSREIARPINAPSPDNLLDFPTTPILKERAYDGY